MFAQGGNVGDRARDDDAAKPLDKPGQSAQFAPAGAMLVADTFNHQYIAGQAVQQCIAQNATVGQLQFDRDNVADQSGPLEQRSDPAQVTHVGQMANG